MHDLLPKLDLDGRREAIVNPWALIECLLRTLPSRPVRNWWKPARILWFTSSFFFHILPFPTSYLDGIQWVPRNKQYLPLCRMSSTLVPKWPAIAHWPRISLAVNHCMTKKTIIRGALMWHAYLYFNTTVLGFTQRLIIARLQLVICSYTLTGFNSEFFEAIKNYFNATSLLMTYALLLV